MVDCNEGWFVLTALEKTILENLIIYIRKFSLS